MGLSELTIKNRTMQLPIFMPDATRGVIRSIDSQDLAATKIEGVIVNTYHLMSEPGTSVIRSLGGIKAFMGWDGWVISDSGGFQVLSMIYRNSSFGIIRDEGVTFYRSSKGGRAKYSFTPEKSIEVQMALGSDILICLDDCPAINASPEAVRVSVDRTIAWAKRCKEEFERQCQQRGLKADERPLLFGVIQGGNDQAERERCADGLKEIGFDGYGFGGWPLADGVMNYDILRFTAGLMSDNLPKYALGIGNPLAIVECVAMGYTIFDTVLPTRDARHQRLYVFNRNPEEGFDERSFGFVQIGKERYVRDQGPVSEWCDCPTCQRYSRAYLHHLFMIEDSLAGRLATIHNLRMYSILMEKLRHNGYRPD